VGHGGSFPDGRAPLWQVWRLHGSRLVEKATTIRGLP
jgi:hypothetical protein